MKTRLVQRELRKVNAKLDTVSKHAFVALCVIDDEETRRIVGKCYAHRAAKLARRAKRFERMI